MILSPSSISLHTTCPHRFFREKILQDLDPTVEIDTSAADAGREAHSWFEKAALGEQSWPESFPDVEPWFRSIILDYPKVAVERKLALDQELQPCGFDDSTAMVRGIADLLLWDGATGRMRVVDYKTGKVRRGAHAFQMKFYALACFLHSEKVREVTTDVYWVRHDVHDVRRFQRGQIGDLAKTVESAVAHVENDVEFPKRKSGLCRGYCPVVDCEHNKPPRQPSYTGPNFTFRG